MAARTYDDARPIYNFFLLLETNEECPGIMFTVMCNEFPAVGF